MIKDFKLFESKFIIPKGNFYIKSLMGFKNKFNDDNEFLKELYEYCENSGILEFTSNGRRIKIRVNDSIPVFFKRYIDRGKLLYKIYFVDNKNNEYLVNLIEPIHFKRPEKFSSEVDPFGEEYYEP